MNGINLKASIAFYKNPTERGLLPWVKNSFFRKYSPIIGQLEKVIATLPDGELSCEDLVKVGKVLFNVRFHAVISPADALFIQDLQIALFGSYAKYNYIRDKLVRAHDVFLALKTLVNHPTLIDNKYVECVVKYPDTEIVRCFSVLKNNKRLLELFLSFSAHAKRDMSAYAEILPHMLREKLVCEEYLKSIDCSIKPMKELLDAFTLLADSGLMNAVTAQLLATCKCSLDEMKCSLLILQKAGLKESSILGLVKSLDASFGFLANSVENTVVELIDNLQSMQQLNILNETTIALLVKNTYTTKETCDALIKLKKANLFETKYLVLLTDRYGLSAIADVIILLHSAGLLANNLEALQNSCHNDYLKTPLEQLNRIGLLNQTCFELIRKGNPETVATTITLLHENGLFLSSLDNLKRNVPVDFVGVNNKLALLIELECLNQANVDLLLCGRLSPKVINTLCKEHEAALQRHTFVCNMNGTPNKPALVTENNAVVQRRI